MPTVDVPVLKPLTFQGRSYVRGEMVTLPQAFALAFARRGFVTLTRGVDVPLESNVMTVNEGRSRLILPPVEGGDTVYPAQTDFSMETMRDPEPAEESQPVRRRRNRRRTTESDDQ